MKHKYLICLLFCCMGFVTVYGQWDPQISQYWRVKPFFNPAFAANADSLETSVLHRTQWVGIPNAPKTFIASASMPFNFLDLRHGVGLTFMSESIGLFKNSNISGQYAYRKKFKNKSLNVGIQVSMMSITFDASGIHIPKNSDSHNVNDEAIPPGSNEASSAFDGTLGVTWVAPHYYVGLSAAHLLEPTFSLIGKTQPSASDNNTHESYIPRTYYLTGGYNIQLKNPLYELQPSVLLKAVGNIYQVDVTARMVYNKMFNGGISWRKEDAVVFLLGFTYKSFDAGYAYDLSISEIAKASSGSHEFFLRYNMPVDLAKIGKNKHKSIRIL